MHFHSLLPLVGLTLLHESLAASVMRRAPAVSSNLPAGYNYLGCYVDSPQDRQLTGASYTDTSGMTEDTCISFCNSKGYEEAGLEYGSECYCGHQFQDKPSQVSDSECNTPCAGDSSEVCGAANRMSVFSNGIAAPVSNPGTNGWTLVGCYSDTVTARTLSASVNVAGSSGLTISDCVSTCQAAGYSYAGAEYGSECYCDTAVRNGALVEPSGCDSTCSGNASEYCGGAFRIDVYRLFSASTPTPSPIPAGWTSLGCYNDNVSSRTLSTPESVAGGSSNMTIEGCLQACQNASFRYAGLEFGQECFCDNQIENGAGVTSDPSACHYPCSGNTAETCGGSSVLNLYSYSQSGSSKTPSSLSLTRFSSTMSQSLTAASTSIVTTLTTTTTTTSSACTATSTSTTPYLSNGDFEQGLSGWNTQPYQGTFDVTVPSDGASYHGCREVSILPTSPQSSNRQLALFTTLTNLRSGSSYTISLAIGRTTTTISSNQAPYIAIVSNSYQVAGGYICGFANTGACPTSGYQVISARFQAAIPRQELRFVFTWLSGNGSGSGSEAVVIDAVDVVAR